MVNIAITNVLVSTVLTLFKLASYKDIILLLPRAEKHNGYKKDDESQ
jgi:hypothetical protein